MVLNPLPLDHMTARTLLVRLALGASLIAAAPVIAAAQTSGPTSVTTATTASAVRSVGPRLDAAVAGVRLQVADAPRLPAPAVASRTGRGQAMAIVGGAAFLGGLIIGDDVGTVIAVGGLGVGLYGLWLWLK